ncbi:hypothetical protein pb186bvf_009308 [Paramecium bursaria]
MKLVYFAYKIKDGLYIGNQRAPTEQEFLNVNKITHILNCASKQIEIQFPNLLSLPFDDSDEQVIVTEENMIQIYEFLENANELGEGVLICSLRGQSRALTVLTAYFMKKYCWGLYKTLQFLNQRRKDFEIRGSFLRQLIQYEKNIFKNKKQSTGWENSNETPEGLLLRNTYLNSQIQAIDDDKLLTKGFNQSVGWSENLVELLDEANLKQNNQQNNRSILKSGGRRRLAKFYQKSSAPEEDFKVLEQNILIKYTTPKVQEIKFTPKQQQIINQNAKNNSFQKVKRSPKAQSINITIDEYILRSDTTSFIIKKKRITTQIESSLYITINLSQQNWHSNQKINIKQLKD